VVLTPFKSQAMLDYAAVLLPVSPFSETSGTFVNTEGRVQSFFAAAKPLGEARPAWKVLRVLGNLLEQAGFDYNSSEDVRAEAWAASRIRSGLDNGIDGVALNLASTGGGHRARRRCADPLCRSLVDVRSCVAACSRFRGAVGAHECGDAGEIGVAAGDAR
jgi:NADH-quinone oxidoreductase subunit G